MVDSNKNPRQIAILHWYQVNRITRFAVGSNPIGVAFDGANIWVANNGSDNVTKLRASNGKTLGIFAIGIEPEYGPMRKKMCEPPRQW